MDVIVVGGGPVGLMTAALLDAAGVAVEVLERNPGPSGLTRGATVHPRTLELLTQVYDERGRPIIDALIERARRVDEAHYAVLPRTLDYRDLDTPYPFALSVPQWRVEEALLRALRARSVPVQHGAEVVAVEQTIDGVRVRVGDRWRTAAFVVGADGARSLVRTAIGVDFPGTAPDMVGFVADIRPAAPPTRIERRWTTDGFAQLVPLDDDLVRVFGVQARDTRLTGEQARTRQAEPVTVAELTAALTTITGTDPGIRAMTWSSRTTNASRWADAYRRGRVFLAGDAAHVHLPAGGQGLNTGLQDAANLAWKLALEVRDRATRHVIDGPGSYDAERRPVAARLVADTRAQDALMHTFTPAGAALRDLFAGFLAHRGEVARQLAGHVSGLATAYPGVGGAHALVGTRAPGFALARGSVVHALRPDRFLLLVLDGDAPAPSKHLDVHRVSRAGRPEWGDVPAVLIRPDGHVAAIGTPDEAVAALDAWVGQSARMSSQS